MHLYCRTDYNDTAKNLQPSITVTALSSGCSKALLYEKVDVTPFLTLR